MNTITRRLSAETILPDTLKGFLSFVEIKTKVTSVFPFLLGLAYLISSGYEVDFFKTAVLFGGMFFFDLTATAANNYFDTKKNQQALQFSLRTARALLLLLFVASIFWGLFLVYLTDVIVLFLGALCFFFGIMYSCGPVPISHGPYGEIVSGFFYGLLIPAILLYINIPGSGLFTYFITEGKLSLFFDIRSLLGLLLLSVLPFCLTANIMLANNICDLKNDLAVKRYTLAYYLGPRALWLFAALYYTAYLSVIGMVLAGFLTPFSLALLVTLLWVQKNINIFLEKQVKGTTFIVSVKNFLIVIVPHILLILLGGFPALK
ncbi:MAG: UbiA family prenyltransferase [Firmicutes bacterium]|nr:UbiA family prenyltransferase [Bacillota bacterium]